MTTDQEAGRTETAMGRKQLAVLHPVHGYKIKPQQNLKTIKRNARERTRVENVNKSFESLRLQIPRAAAMGKLSKVSILAEAVDYIQYLHTLVNANNNLQQSFNTGEVEDGYYSDVQMSPTSPQTWIPSEYSPQYSPQCSPDKDGYNLQTEEQQYKMHSHYSSEKQYRESVFHYNSSEGHSSSPPHSSFSSSTLDYESWPKTDETKDDLVNSFVEWQH